jgi:hypothetical protein
MQYSISLFYLFRPFFYTCIYVCVCARSLCLYKYIIYIRNILPVNNFKVYSDLLINYNDEKIKIKEVFNYLLYSNNMNIGFVKEEK